MTDQQTVYSASDLEDYVIAADRPADPVPADPPLIVTDVTAPLTKQPAFTSSGIPAGYRHSDQPNKQNGD